MADAAPSASPEGAAPATSDAAESQGPIEIRGVLPEGRQRFGDGGFVPPPSLEDESSPDPEQPEDDPAARLTKIEQKYRTLQGVHKGLESAAKRGKEAESLYNQQRESALAWQQRAQALEAQLLAASQGSKQVPPSPEAGTEAQPLTKAEVKLLRQEALASIDEDQYAAIAEKHGERGAQAWQESIVLDHIQSYIDDKVSSVLKALEERIKPFEVDAENAGFVAEAKNVFAHVRDAYKFADGSWMFPELYDAEQARAVAQLWNHQRSKGAWSEKFALDPESVVHAISLYREIRRYQERLAPQPQPTPTAPVVVRPASVDMDASVAPIARSTGPRTAADELRASFLRNDKGNGRGRIPYAP
jgi:hypothetical protein